VKADEGIAPAQNAMLFLDLQKLQWEDRCRQTQLLFRDKEGDHDLFLAPSAVQRTVLFEDGTVVGRDQEKDVQVGATLEKFPPNSTAVEQHTLQLLPEHTFNLLHVGLQQFLCVVRQSLDQTFGRAHIPHDDIRWGDFSCARISGRNPAAITRSIRLNGGIVRKPAVVDRT
jgi:hypothetical protein